MVAGHVRVGKHQHPSAVDENLDSVGQVDRRIPVHLHHGAHHPTLGIPGHRLLAVLIRGPRDFPPDGGNRAPVLGQQLQQLDQGEDRIEPKQVLGKNIAAVRIRSQTRLMLLGRSQQGGRLTLSRNKVRARQLPDERRDRLRYGGRRDEHAGLRLERQQRDRAQRLVVVEQLARVVDQEHPLRAVVDIGAQVAAERSGNQRRLAAGLVEGFVGLRLIGFVEPGVQGDRLDVQLLEQAGKHQ